MGAGGLGMSDLRNETYESLYLLQLFTCCFFLTLCIHLISRTVLVFLFLAT